jgi:hypothetical protein
MIMTETKTAETPKSVSQIVEEIRELRRQNPRKKIKLTKSQIDAMREYDRELVKGIFNFHEVPGGSMSFVYKAYDGEPVERVDVFDGEVKTVSRGVARHLKQNLWYPEYDFVKDEDTKNVIRATKKTRRASFQLLDSIDDEIQNSIIEATFV